MSNVAIIGKGSKLYSELKNNSKTICIEKEYSTAQFLEEDQLDPRLIYIVFSLLDKEALEEKFGFQKEIQLVFIGSTAALSSLSNRFSYARLKRDQADFCKANDNCKYLYFGDFKSVHRSGRFHQSDKHSFWDCIDTAIAEPQKFFYFFTVIGATSRIGKFVGFLDLHLSPFSTLFIKYCSNFTYGYSNADNSRETYE
jgi:hypothetical protein